MINIHDVESPSLSFYNLCEAHVLSVLRKEHRIRLDHIRNAIAYVKRTFKWDRPLIQQEFRVDGAKLFIEKSKSIKVKLVSIFCLNMRPHSSSI